MKLRVSIYCDYNRKSFVFQRELSEDVNSREDLSSHLSRSDYFLFHKFELFNEFLFLLFT